MLVRQNKNITAQGELEGAILIVSWNTISRGECYITSVKSYLDILMFTPKVHSQKRSLPPACLSKRRTELSAPWSLV